MYITNVLLHNMQEHSLGFYSVVNNHDISSQILTFSSEKMTQLGWKCSI